ncbi:calcium uptake protein 1 homolog, mitochondrial isoform X5 [Eurosta solidaginis]|uniref:calcium uptake protein 1 homolog, mitochondrial isoform X5 n=1 Tax=Eurosta solidaginis TaxID=178769 RepID=UPI0035310588
MSLLRQCGAAFGRPNVFQSALLRSLIAGGRKSTPNCAITTNMNVVRGHKNFGHKQEPTPRLTRYFHFIIGTFFFVSILDFKKIKEAIMPKVDADAPKQKDELKTNGDTPGEESEDSGGETETDLSKSKKQKKMGFRDRKDVAECLKLHLAKDSIFYKLGSYGLITFSDYIFLLTVLSTSRRHFEIAFQMFDLNGDGDVDSEEFEMVADLVRQQSTIGSRHRDHVATGNTFKGVNSALTHYFFGPNLDEKLTIQKFIHFQTQLQREILTLEFERKHPNNEGLITEVDFAELLVAYAGYSHKKKSRKLKRVKRKFKENPVGISKNDYLDFFHFLSNINDVDTALTFYHIAGASIDQATLKHVAKTVAMVDLRDHVIDVVFTIFDEDNDNQLSNREFVAVMKNRLQRGLEKSKDTGFIKMMRSILKCAKETKPVLLDL